MICPRCNKKISFWRNLNRINSLIKCKHCKAELRRKYKGINTLANVVNLLISVYFGFEIGRLIVGAGRSGIWALTFPG